MKNKFIRGLFTTATMIMALHINAFAFETVNMNLSYDGIDHKYIAPEIILVVDGKQMQHMPMPPVIINDYTMVPAREIFEQLGALVNWNAISNQVFITYGAELVALQINNTVAYLNNDPIVMDTAPKIINGKTMVPLRFAAEALGFKVGWDPATRIVSVDYDTVIAMPQTGESPIIPNTPATSGELEGKENLNETAGDTKDIVPAVDISSGPLVEASYPETKINSIELLEGGSQGMKVSSASEISKVVKMLLPDNRLILDFYGAEMNLSATVYTPSVSSSFKAVRAAQNQLVPEKITRVVMDLENAATYAITMAADRKSVTVSFEKNNITDISFSSDGVYDYINITGTKPPTSDISTLSEPEQLVMDIPYSAISGKDAPVNGRFSAMVRSSQFDANTSRIVVDLKSRVKYTLSYNQNTLVIRLEEPTYKNINYMNATKTIVLKKDQGTPLNISMIGHQDRYSQNQYILTLPGNYKGIYGYGEYEINDTNVRSIDIQTSDTNTQIIINERKVFVIGVSEDNDNIYISLRNPKEVYSKIVVLDPGHGGSDPGTSGAGVDEKDLTLDISQRVIALLEANYATTGIKVYATRTADTYISRFDRAPYANEIGDMFVSIHINSTAPNAVPNGTETYFHPHDNDSTIGVTTKQMADIFHKHMLGQLGFADRKVKQNTYTVLLDTKIPSVLLETGFISNTEEAEKLKNPEYRQAAAQAIYNGILETFGLYRPAR